LFSGLPTRQIVIGPDRLAAEGETPGWHEDPDRREG